MDYAILEVPFSFLFLAMGVILIGALRSYDGEKKAGIRMMLIGLAILGLGFVASYLLNEAGLYGYTIFASTGSIRETVVAAAQCTCAS